MHLLEFSDCQDVDARIKMIDFPIESYSISVKLWLDALMQRIKPLLTGINEFEHRDKSILVAFFGYIGYNYTESNVSLKMNDFQTNLRSQI